MKFLVVSFFLLAPGLVFSQSGKKNKQNAATSQFVLFDVVFTYTKEDADN
jgi:hypothetical protein